MTAVNACQSCNDLLAQVRAATSRITELERQLVSERQDVAVLSELVDVQRDGLRSLAAEHAEALELSANRAKANRELYARAMSAESELDALRARGFFARVFG